jgi:hypothetical protein
MVRRKGELTRKIVNRDYPHQVILPASLCTGVNLDIHDAFCRDLSRAPRRHSVVINDEWHIVHCFAQEAHANLFRERFGGARFDPKRLRAKSWHLLKPET